MKPYATVSCNLDQPLLQTLLPLFREEKVQAIEWSFDALYKLEVLPDWFEEILQAFSREGRLIGHGIFFSLFSGKFSMEQHNWLTHLQTLTERYHFDHITEHFGFMTGPHFHMGAPMAVPMTPTTLAIGQDRLKRIANACQRPVGLENLAYAPSPEVMKVHGQFLQSLIEPVDGFIILDLHNLYCQAHNFEVAPASLLSLYPLDRVREIHISGGSWAPSDAAPGGKVRRDTHDDRVPEAVFQLLTEALPHCPNVKFVVLEQMGIALETEAQQAGFRNDFMRMEKVIAQHTPQGEPMESFLPPLPFDLPPPIESESLFEQQQVLSEILETATSTQDALTRVSHSSLTTTAWNIENWSPHMLETAMKIAQKWKDGWFSNASKADC